MKKVAQFVQARTITSGFGAKLNNLSDREQEGIEGASLLLCKIALQC